MYTWNDQSVDFWREEGVLRNTVPLELNEGELKHRDNTSSELLLYGYIPDDLPRSVQRKIFLDVIIKIWGNFKRPLR